MTVSEVSKIITEIAPIIGADTISKDAPGEHWTVVFDEQTCIFLSLDLVDNTLRLEADIGPIESNDAAILARLLAANDYTGPTDGNWTALDDTGAMAMLYRKIGLADMTAEKLKSGILTHFDALREWREVIPYEVDRMPGTDTETDSNLEPPANGAGDPMQGIIRV
ncbi:MAG: type III secretion system chaperone [Pseudomonadota bacterium]